MRRSDALSRQFVRFLIANSVAALVNIATRLLSSLLLNDPISRVDVISGSVSRTVEVRWGETPWSTQRWDGSADAAGGKITTIT